MIIFYFLFFPTSNNQQDKIKIHVCVNSIFMKKKLKKFNGIDKFQFDSNVSSFLLFYFHFLWICFRFYIFIKNHWMTSLSIIIRIFRILFLLSFKKIMILLSSYRIIQFFQMIEYAWKKRGEERRNRDYKYDETDQQTLQSSFKSIFIFIFTILLGFSFFCVWIFVSRVIKKRLLIPFCYLLFWYKSKSIHFFFFVLIKYFCESRRDERNSSHTDRTMWQSNRSQGKLLKIYFPKIDEKNEMEIEK